jgi:hypothetical protein
MGQDFRRRRAAGNRHRSNDEDEAPAPLGARRFSDGFERAVLNQLRLTRAGRFSRGDERLPDDAGRPTYIGPSQRSLRP